jgi:hypothetical protein
MPDKNIPADLLPELERLRTEAVVVAALALVQANDRLKNAFCYTGHTRKIATDKLAEDQQLALNGLRVALMATGRYSL